MAETTSNGGFLEGMAILAGFQLAGEMGVRLARLPLPGPVAGMFLLFLWLVARGSVPRGLRIASNGLLENLALLFVPATVGAFLDIASIADEALAVVVAIVASTFLAMAATAGTFLLLERGRKDRR